MARRRRLLRLKLRQKSLQSFAALALLLTAFLILLSFLAPAGLSKPLLVLLNEFFGKTAFLLPVLLLLLGLSLTQIKWAITEGRVFSGVLLLFFVLVIGFELMDKGSSGRLGFWIFGPLVAIFGNFGMLLILTAGTLVAALMIFNASLDEILLQVAAVMAGSVSFVNRYLLRWTREFFARRKEAGKVAKKPVEAVAPKIHEEVKEEAKEEVEKEIQIRGMKEPKLEIVQERTVLRPKTEAEPTVELAKPQAGELTGLVPAYQIPPLSFLSEPEQISADRGDIAKNAKIIEKTLESFGIQARVSEVNLGPSVTQYALELTEGTKIAKITALQNDLALALAAPTGNVRIEAPIPGRSLVGIEVPNFSATLVTLKSILTAEIMQRSHSKLMLALGQNVAGEPVAADLSKWPHILVAGATGSGKSVLLHAFIASVLFRAMPSEVRFILVDPKRVELTAYSGIPHLLTPVIVETEKVISALKWAVHEMEKRYRLFTQVGARNLADFNQLSKISTLPYIVIVVDELADIMAYAPGEVESLITRIAQMSRATGIHLVLSTQRPSVDVITGLIKANIPARLALNVSSGTDSRVILDTTGAEKLLGRGDMLYLPPDAAKPQRIQGVYVSDEEQKKLIAYLKQFAAEETAITAAAPAKAESSREAGEEVSADALLGEALEVVFNNNYASASLLQRRLRVGYARAARLLDEMEDSGLIGPKDGANPREVFAEKVTALIEKLRA